MSKDIKVGTSNNRQSLTELKIPQLGEGLRETRIIRLLKNPGDLLKEDEVIYEIETEKSMVEVESPYTGYLVEWFAQEGDVLEVGSVLATVKLLKEATISSDKKDLASDSFLEEHLLPSTADQKKIDIRGIPPRIRAYCKQRNISEETMLSIPVSNRTLTIEDVEKFLGQQLMPKETSTQQYKETYFSAQQQALNFRFKRSAEVIIPATLVSTINMDNIKPAVYSMLNKKTMKDTFVSEFQLFAYLVTRVLAKHPKFRSVIMDNKKYHEYKYLNLGIAVETEQNELVTAVIPCADQLSIDEFITTMHQKIDSARKGDDQVTGANAHVILTYMGSDNALMGAPVLVSPVVATLFLGRTINDAEQRTAYLSLTFDHRLINGMDAERFFQTLNIALERTELPISGSQEGIDSSESAIGKNQDLVTSFKGWLIDRISTLLNIKANNIDLEESLGIQGLDSIKAVELASNLSSYFNASIPATIVWHYPNCNSLIHHLVERFDLSRNGDNSKNDIEEVFNIFKDLSPSEITALFEEIGIKDE